MKGEISGVLSILFAAILVATLTALVPAPWPAGVALAQSPTTGTVFGWGYNYRQQIEVPPGPTGVTAIAAGGNHSLALESDGTVVACGANYHGPTSVPAGLTRVTAIAVGGSHNLALQPFSGVWPPLTTRRR